MYAESLNRKRDSYLITELFHDTSSLAQFLLKIFLYLLNITICIIASLRKIYFQVVQLLLNRGALLHRDHNGRTPFHLAAMSGYSQTMELLFSFHSHMLDQLDKDGVSYIYT